MTVNNFAFTPADGLRNAVSFPTTPASEADARDQVQDISDQLRDYINNTITAELNNKLALTGGSLTGDLSTTGKMTATGLVTGSALFATGLAGATAASRHAGATTSGAPSSGTFAKGDYVIDQTGPFWVCTTAGTPGTWTKVGLPTGAVTALSGGTKVQSGTTGVVSSVTFPVAFATVPVIVIVPEYNGTGTTSSVDDWIVTKSTTGFTFNCASTDPTAHHWIAIGT